jgi:DUF1707 SHOCT-like domain
MTTDAELRASDAERTETIDVLRRHHAEGRLDTAELEERVGRCYTAKTRGELDALTADLPGPWRRRRSGGRPPRFPVPLVAIAVLVAVSITTHAHVLWLVFPLAFFTFARLRWRMAHARSGSPRRYR